MISGNFEEINLIPPGAIQVEQIFTYFQPLSNGDWISYTRRIKYVGERICKIGRMIVIVVETIGCNPTEALQAMWFCSIVIINESPGIGLGFLRADLYLYPFYQKDIESGRMTKEEAFELIALFYIKANGVVIPYPTPVAKIFLALP